MADGSIDKLSISIGASSARAVTQINKLADAFRQMRTALSVIDSGSAGKIQALAEALSKLKGVGTINIGNKFPGQLAEVASAVNSISEDSVARLERLSTALQGMKGLSMRTISAAAGSVAAADAAAIPAVTADTTAINTAESADMTQVTETAKEASSALNEMQESAKGAAEGVKEVGEAGKKSGGMLKGFISALGRIAMYRMLRSIIKSVTTAFSEGAKATVNFAKTSGGHLQYLATAYDNLANHGSMMSGQLGASLATLVAAVTPLLLRLINLITAVADAMTQLFAALGGHGFYAKATKGVKGWGDAAGGAAKAAKEWKNQLMGFDEINRLEEPADGGGGGGGGGAGGNFEFEEAELSGWAKWIKEHLELVKGLAIAIGAALAAWKITTFIKQLPNGINDMKQILGIAMAVAGAVLLVKGTVDAVKNGLDFDSLTEMIGGTLLVTLGLALAFGKVGAAIGLLVGSIALIAVGLREWIKTGKLSTEAFVALEVGILGVGVAISLLTGSWIPLLIAAIAGIALAIYKYWDEIKDFTSKTWTAIKEIFQQTLSTIKTNAEELTEKIKTRFKTKWEEIKQDASTKWDGIKENLSNKWEEIKTKCQSKLDNLKETIRTKLQQIKDLFNITMGPPKIKLPHLSVTGSFSIRPPSVPTFHVSYYASGGFPEDGMFMANHGELVGKFSNGKTAVANNEQIVEGISAGVESANENVVSAIYTIADRLVSAIEENGGGGEINFDEFVRGITRTQKRQARALG